MILETIGTHLLHVRCYVYAVYIDSEWVSVSCNQKFAYLTFCGYKPRSMMVVSHSSSLTAVLFSLAMIQNKLRCPTTDS